MLKKLWLLFFIPTIIFAKEIPTPTKAGFNPEKDPLQQDLIQEPKDSQNKTLTSRNVAIAFDLHGVLFQFNYGGAASLALSYSTVVALAQHIFGFKGFMVSIAPLLLPLAYGSITYGWFFLKNGFAPTIEHHIFGGPGIIFWILRKIWLWLSAFYIPRLDLIDLAWNLKHKGYKIILASNIGPLALEELKKRYPKVFTKNGINLFDGIWQPRIETSWITKPHQEFFIGLREECNRTWPLVDTILFIDNKKKNLKHAVKSDKKTFYIPIFFSETARLKQELKSLKIM